MCRLLLSRITDMSREGMVECFPVDVLGMRGQMGLHRGWKVVVCLIRHGRFFCMIARRVSSHGRKRAARCQAAPAMMPAERGCDHAFLIAIFFSLFWASAVFGNVTVSTPFLNCASILSVSTPSGTANARWKEP